MDSSPRSYSFTSVTVRIPVHIAPKCGTEPIRYVTVHFRDRHGAASLRLGNRAEITVLVSVNRGRIQYDLIALTFVETRCFLSSINRASEGGFWRRVDLLQVDLLVSGASLVWPRSGRPRATKSDEGLFWKSRRRVDMHLVLLLSSMLIVNRSAWN